MSKNPMPTVTFDGKSYSLRVRLIDVPDLSKMDRIGALIWMAANTTRRGYQNPRPLIAATVST